MKQCFRCKQTKELDQFIARRDRNSLHSYCKSCNTAMIDIQRRAMKEKAVNYKGGKCQVCGYKKCHRALHFHHVDPNQKEFSLGWIRTNGWPTVVKELDKCVLLCSNCHAEVHDGIIPCPPL